MIAQTRRLVLLISILTSICSTCSAQIYQAQGELCGEVTTTSALVQSRLTAIPGPQTDSSGDVPGSSGIARFEWSTSPTFETSQFTTWMQAQAEHDFIVRAELTHLKPETQYYYRLSFGTSETDARPGAVRQFRTLPAADARTSVTFCMGSCMNYHSFMAGKANGGGPVTASPEDKQLGYPSFAAMEALQPNFFIGTGDIVYYDHPPQTAAMTLPDLRKKWHEQFRFPRMVSYFAGTPAYWSKDDHDFRFNDADLGGEKLPQSSTGISLFREQLPILPAEDNTSPTYRTHRINRHLQLWFVEGRDYRSPNRMPDGPDKSIWGIEQRTWLQNTLRESDATWKIIITPTPMVGPDRASKKDNHTNPDGFRHEADTFFAWLTEHKVQNVMTFCGDRHWQYHSIHPCGVEEFCCGALNDENAIKGVRPGSKGSTDPDGLIRQPFLYEEPTGGFLHVSIDATDVRPRLAIQFHDDHGTLQYRTEK